MESLPIQSDMHMGLKDGDKIVTVDNKHIENFMEITSNIALNNLKTIQVERDGAMVNIDIPKEYIPKMLKGKGQIEPRMPFGPFVVAAFGKESPGKSAGVQIGDQMIGLDNIRNSITSMSFRSMLPKIRIMM